MDFILDAVNKLSGAEPDQHDIKYSVLHVWSGIELLLKFRLACEHWSLIFSKVDQASLKKFQSGDFQSVTFAETQIRLEGIAGIELEKDQQELLKKLQQHRNKAEHFHLDLNKNAAVATLLKAWNFVFDFIHQHVPESAVPDDANATFDEIKTQMLGHRKFVDARRKHLRGSLIENRDAVISLPLVRCPHCLELAMLLKDGIGNCLFCYSEMESEDVMEPWADFELDQFDEDYIGVEDCPDCETQTFFELPKPGEFSTFSFVCFNCCSGWTLMQIERCGRCHTPLAVEEEGGAICSNCLASYD